MLLKSEIYTNEHGVEMKCDYFGYIDTDGNEVVTGKIDSPNATPETVEPEPSQLDRIESAIKKSQEEIAQEARDAYTDLLMEEGVL